MAGRSGIFPLIASHGIAVIDHVCLNICTISGDDEIALLASFTLASARQGQGTGKAIEKAGAIGLEIEAVPYEVGQAVDDAIDIFTFSIGAGAAGTCQMLNGYDLIGAFDTFKPKFAKRYGNVADVAVEAFKSYVADVRSGAFPNEDHSYHMKTEEAAKLKEALKSG